MSRLAKRRRLIPLSDSDFESDSGGNGGTAPEDVFADSEIITADSEIITADKT